MDDLTVDATIADWPDGEWLNPPPSVERGEGEMTVTAAAGSDFWRVTSYGFVHDDGHALLAPLAVGRAVEVSFVAAFDQQFDQAGVLVRADAEHWVKAGVELSDGELQLGAVATRTMSDWSLHPEPSWAGRAVTIRASRGPDSLTVRACRADDHAAPAWQVVRVTPFVHEGRVLADPFCCAPTREGLTVRFTGFRITAGDAALHPS